MNEEFPEIDQIIDRIIEAGLAKRELIEPCSDDEVAQLQQLQPSVTLPSDYIYFMKKAGKIPIRYFNVALSIRPALFAVDTAEEMIDSDNNFDLSDKLFIGLYKFDAVYYFKKGESGVYCFDEVEELKEADTFTEFLKEQTDISIRDHIGAIEFANMFKNTKP
ncbi:SMI1/KNR4 family protein [Marinactinospora rubrisoli]|uniref:SMI1/KNR4 family protein n=1 Tax=Marinactinospora rubrisoli TaxID=2715399 RepID=A0ABW2KG27_9ACTN